MARGAVVLRDDSPARLDPREEPRQIRREIFALVEPAHADHNGIEAAQFFRRKIIAGELAHGVAELREVFRDAVKVNENDNWGGAAVLSNAFEQVGAFLLSRATSGDSALLLTLAPGGYTAQLSGVNNATGIGLIEVYELP